MSALLPPRSSDVDPASLVAFRVLYGLLVAAAVVRYFANGWIEDQFETPTWFFVYEGLGWIRALPAPWMRVVFGAIGVAGLCVAAGCFHRVAAATVTVGFAWIQLCDKSNYLNHYYLVVLLGALLTVLPVHRAGSVDAWRRPAIRRTTLPRASLDVLRLQVGLVYVFAGIAKLGPDWLLRGEPLRTWLGAAEGVPIVGPLLATPFAAIAASWLGAILDLALPFAVLHPRTRWPAFAVLVVFHAATAVLFPIGLFPVFMTAFATILLPPSWPRALRIPGVAAKGPPTTMERPKIPRAIRAAAWAWMLVQVIVPLRHLTRTGDVLWAEDGFRFSWRVMLVEKSGHARFEVTDPVTGTRFERGARGLLTPYQERTAATQPDMIYALARRIGEVERERLGRAVEVRAIVDVAFNGRPSRPYVDRRVELARRTETGVPPNWILPPP